MSRPAKITRIIVTRYHYPIAGRAMDPVKRLDMLYQPGGPFPLAGACHRGAMPFSPSKPMPE